MKYRTTNKTVSESYLDVAILHPDDHVVREDLVQLDQEAATNHSSVLRPVDQSQLSIHLLYTGMGGKPWLRVARRSPRE